MKIGSKIPFRLFQTIFGKHIRFSFKHFEGKKFCYFWVLRLQAVFTKNVFVIYKIVSFKVIKSGIHILGGGPKGHKERESIKHFLFKIGERRIKRYVFKKKLFEDT